MPTKSDRDAQAVPSSPLPLIANNQNSSLYLQRFISVVGKIRSVAKNQESGAAAGSPTQYGSRAKIASPDQELIALCQNFRAKLHKWIEQVRKLGIESYDENEDTGRALHALRVEWGNSLDTLRGLEPCTVEGANEKLNAAQVFLTFSCEADGSAAELLALATRELDHVTANLRVSDRAQISRPVNTQGPLGWFERLTRRA